MLGECVYICSICLEHVVIHKDNRVFNTSVIKRRSEFDSKWEEDKRSSGPEPALLVIWCSQAQRNIKMLLLTRNRSEIALRSS